MGLIKNKKGVIFTVMAIVIAIFFTVLFSGRVEKPLDYKVPVVETRITVLNGYMNNFFDYAEVTGSISGYSSLQGIITDITVSGYNANFESEYLYCMETGNLTTSQVCPNMINKTIIYYLDSIKTLAEDELNIKSNYVINSISMAQTTDAFSMEVYINLSLDITDVLANLSDTRVMTSTVRLEGIEDPLYIVQGTYSNIIRKTSLRRAEGDWKQGDLVQLFNNRTYKNYKDGVSIINRIKGNLSANVYGIESFVDNNLVVYDINDTMVDFWFWDNVKFRCDTVIVVINDTIIPNDFQLDDTHRLMFNISNRNATHTC